MSVVWRSAFRLRRHQTARRGEITRTETIEIGVITSRVLRKRFEHYLAFWAIKRHIIDVLRSRAGRRASRGIRGRRFSWLAPGSALQYAVHKGRGVGRLPAHGP